MLKWGLGYVRRLIVSYSIGFVRNLKGRDRGTDSVIKVIGEWRG